MHIPIPQSLKKWRTPGRSASVSRPEPRTTTLEERTMEVENLYAPFVRNGREDPYHSVLPLFTKQCASIPNCRVLEIGSREVSGVSRRKLFSNAGSYVGMDIHMGPGVDIAGDAHELSQLFPAESFDAVFSCSVFEHLAFPWKVAMEINHVLPVGGLCYLSTHTVWPPHELPWDFWRFPIAGLRLLFSQPLGFRVTCIEHGLPAKVHSLISDAPTRGICEYESPLGVALIAEKTHDYDRDRIRWDVPLSSVLDSIYPNRTA